MSTISHTLHETEDAALPDIGRRHSLLVATSVMGGIGLLATAVPFVASFQPSEQAKALGGPACARTWVARRSCAWTTAA